MTIQDLIQIAKDEGSDPASLHLVISIGGTYYDVVTSDEQDQFNPNLVVMALAPHDAS